MTNSLTPHSGVLKLTPYQSGKPISELKRELGLDYVAKLASNENPLGPSPLALEAINGAAQLSHLYPDSNAHDLKLYLSQFLDINSNQIILGNGSDQILHMALHAYLNPGDEVLLSQYGFASFEIFTHSFQGKPVIIPSKDFKIDLDGIINNINSKTKIIMLANPNNPTGTYFTQNQLEKFLAQIPKNILVILDEAYYEFMDTSDYPDSIKLLNNYSNLLITRTFSKIYGLAGLRLGYGIAHPDLINNLNKIRLPFNVNRIAQTTGIEALKDKIHLEKTKKINKAGMNQWVNFLEKNDLDYIPSVCNFITVNFNQPGVEIYKKLLSQGVIVRPLVPYGLDNYLRISIGTEQENQFAMDKLYLVI